MSYPVSSCPGCPYSGSLFTASAGRAASPVVVVSATPAWAGIPIAEPYKAIGGSELRRAIHLAGIRDADVLFTSATHCSSWKADASHKRAIDACRARLVGEIESSPRAVVVALGSVALRSLLGPSSPALKEVDGQPLESPWGWSIATVTPNLAERNSAARARLQQGFRAAGAVLLAARVGGIDFASAAPKPQSVEARFWAKVFKTDSCWYWTGFRDSWGYGSFTVGGKNLRAHRYAYELVVGPIPFGLTIDHLCRERACVNPVHLEAVTGAENTERAFRVNVEI